MLTAGYNVMGYKSYEWGRYFYIAAVISQGNLHSSSENAFFHDNSLRLLPITSVADQGPHVSGSYNEGLIDGQNNLQAVLAAFGGVSNFPVINGLPYCAFAIDSEDNSGPATTSEDYMRGWITALHDGIVSGGVTLTGWAGIYNGLDNCGTWDSLVSLAATYDLRPDFIWIACYPGGSGAVPPWDEGGCTDTEQGDCHIAIGQATGLWQHYGDYNTPSGYVDLDLGNPNLDFHTALGQYAPTPPA